MKLTPAMQNFILHWGEMGSRWGVNRSVAQIHALLHIATNPMTADEICEVLGLARSNVSNGLKELQAQGLVKVSRQLGDRRDHFTSIRDMFDLVDAVIAARREREFAPTLRALADVMKEAEADNTPKAVKDRMGETLRVMRMFDDWYADFSRLPRSVHLAVLKLGAKVARFLPGVKKQE
ncbi:MULTISPECIES: GbsR/MarR family transcriptional regulator [unclassified Leisingera]|uniref:GbsR/MarR family transcriptional regulator n=1 Tax=unclassified Leisingera TaxID=2614906 RepID=UPI0021A3E786|nr:MULTISPECIES: MarR family transcriptional regulator [unclassified Leisingera]UWQ75512.1 MarR family transcriptional regulator [Leisingera sp. M658]